MNFFTNESVSISSLPQAQEVSLQPIDSGYRKVLLWGWMIGWGIITLLTGLIVFFSPSLHSFLWIAILSGLILILGFFNLWIVLQSFARKAYAVREKDIIYRTGWIVQRFSACPFNRVQHCSVDAGPFERKMGLATLSIFTAGTAGSELKIPGLPESTAFALRDFIMKKTATDEPS